MRAGVYAISTVLSLAMVEAASAQARCTVTDPTGTPLNVRQWPNGPIVGALHNGAAVRRLQTERDDRGRPWSYVVPRGAGQPGWIFREFVSCY